MVRLQDRPHAGPVATSVRELAHNMATAQAVAQTQLTELQVLWTIPSQQLVLMLQQVFQLFLVIFINTTGMTQQDMWPSKAHVFPWNYFQRRFGTSG